jgi:tape measure domain-containing protein
MADKVGNLAIIISGDSKQFMSVMSGVEEHIARVNAKMNSGGSDSGGGILGLGKNALMTGAAAAGISLSAKAIWDMGQNALKSASDFETSEAQLKTLTGSAMKASAVMSELRSFSAGTPFGVGEVAGSARKLMGSGIEQNQAMKATRELTAAAAATGGELSSLARAYAQVTANGRFMTEELNQFSDADFPIMEFAKTAGVTMAQLRDDMSKGLVPVEVMSDTFTRLTTGSGKFSTALADMMKTSAALAKQEEARHEQRMAELGIQLKLAGIGTGASMWNQITEGISTVLAAGAQIVNVLSDNQTFGSTAEESWLRATNPELSKAGIAQQQKDLEALNKERAFNRSAIGTMTTEAMAAIDLDMQLSVIKEDALQSVKAIGEFFKGVAVSFDNQNKLNPFRNAGLIDSMPMAGGFRSAMINGDLDNAALAVQGMRNNLANKARIQLPSAATFGSSAAADTMNNAIAATMGQPIKDTADVLREMKKVEEKQQKDIEEIKTDLRNLKIARF